MIFAGGFLVAVGLIVYVSGVGDGSGWWLAPAGLLAAGVGMLVAGVVTAGRRRLLPLRAARQGTVAINAGGSTGGPVSRARAVPKMIVDAWRGRTALARSQTVLWLIAVVYLVSPVDFLADVVLPVVGIPSDIGVGVWLLTSLYVEAGHYLAEHRAGTSREGTPG